ncbi:hypothetical protein BDP27DRAFT_1321959 [Rhodocollybia butyracea]|uniref:ubiquitinyl hydrolase 1 n=1 Tax=Rhodocollybia butyracea TaxID=206335 RepID=A0A9P5U917_9AGAR|nr:hypothetical protein BDP27DRAFT_1321959 [Rhodocollybia butyracea]
MMIQNLPLATDSPTSSPVSSSSTSAISSRKRQRSTSDNSVTEGESLKRGRLGLDSYMQEQGHLEPSATEKLSRIDKLRQVPLALDQTWYLVDRAWFLRWRASLGDIDPKVTTAPISESELGPPSTSALVDEYSNLKPNLTEEVDFELLPAEAWNLLADWYGAPPKPLGRQTIARGYSKAISIELYPPKFHIYRVVKDEPNETEGPFTISLSAHSSLKDLGRNAAVVHDGSAYSLPQYRVWRLTDSFSHPTRDITTAKFMSVAMNAQPVNIDDDEETLEEASFQSEDAFAVEFQDPTTLEWTMTKDPQAAIEPLFKANDAFFNRMSGASTSSLFSTSSTSKVNGDAKAEVDKKLSTVAKKEKVKVKENWIEPGTLGLGNIKELTEYFLTGVYSRELNPDNPLGMGGAIAEGFGSLLTRMWAGSELAQKYGALDKLRGNLVVRKAKGFGGFGGGGGGGGALNPSASSYSPRDFKTQLSRFAPQFSGYQQHDSQELVAFLLDGLHEDLNRIIKKPYVEKPDWFGARPPVTRPFRERRTEKVDGEEEDKEEYKRAKEEYEAKEREAYLQEHEWNAELEDDKEMLRFARESWDGYKKRNDSVIVDLCQGQYRSTLVCPECQKISITFDPFMYLTLPLPVQKKWRGVVYYIPWVLEKPHLKVSVELGRDSSFRDLRALLGRWMNAPAENLLTLEYFSHRFYKSLDDNVLCGEMGDNDVLICFELPCNSQQSRSWKRSEHPDDPWVLPMFLCDAPTSSFGTGANSFVQRSYSSGPNSYRSSPALFGYPTIAVVTKEEAKSVEGIYGAAVERLARWTKQQRDLWTWELPDGFALPGIDEKVETVRLDAMEEDAVETVTEIGEDGAIVNVMQPVPVRQQPTPPTPAEEGDIVDEKSMVLDLNEDTMTSGLKSAAPVRVGPKKDLFTLRLQTNMKDFGTAAASYSSISVPWESRLEEKEKGEEGEILLRETDGLYCEFDENMKAYYFGDDRSFPKFEHALWENWEEFVHPEYQDSINAAASKTSRGISLSDCLDEFTKQEQLGADDLWYCPQCKKHQQATKKFDLWSTPDILVVHLKRFSNSRMLRDKIDAFVDFPIKGLDLNDRVNERRILSKLKEQGVDTDSIELLGHGGSDQSAMEPLVYDLFAVDEHLGGLGGGHYRAYAQNHMNNKWYHFDDSFVSESAAERAVNSNAYLLFYRRRTSSPLGGQSYVLVEEALKNPPERDSSVSATASVSNSDDETNDLPELENTIQLPTPPHEADELPSYSTGSPTALGTGFTMANWNSSQSVLRSRTRMSSPSLDEEPDFDLNIQRGPIFDSNFDAGYTFPEPSSSMAGDSSPSSSVEVEPDFDSRSDDLDGEGDVDVGSWSRTQKRTKRSAEDDETENEIRDVSPPWSGSGASASHLSSGVASPDHSEELDPFADDSRL